MSIAIEQITLLGAFFNELKTIDAALPFDLLPTEPLAGKETHAIGLFDLPKLFQTTQGEEFIWAHFIDSLSNENGEIDWQAMPIEQTYVMRCVGATLMLMRLDPKWSVGKTLQLGAVEVAELYSFFLGERTGWKAIEAEPTESATEPETEATSPKKAKPPTGRKPIGDSLTTTPQTIASDALPLAVVE